MNSTWLKSILIISLGLNCMIAGVFVYRFVWGRPLGQWFGGPPQGYCNQLFSSLPAESRAAHKLLREKMRAERREVTQARSELMDLIAAPNPDRKRIDAQLDIINKQQAHIGHMAVEQMLEDVSALPADQRAAFIEAMRQSKYFGRSGRSSRGRGQEGCSGWFGRGRGSERGGDRHRSKY